MITFLIIIGIIVYLIIGRIIINILDDNSIIDWEYEMDFWIGTIFFPFVLIFQFIKWVATGISDLFY